MAMRNKVFHTLPPWYDTTSRVLVLGSMPSPKSRETSCYYGHPQNRFWPTLAVVYEEPIERDAEARRVFALHHHIALWDVLACCTIAGADDASISEPVPNDLPQILRAADIRAIFTTGKKAHQLYDVLLLPTIGREAILLPSTSPANRRWFDDAALAAAYREIRRYTDDL